MNRKPLTSLPSCATGQPGAAWRSSPSPALRAVQGQPPHLPPAPQAEPQTTISDDEDSRDEDSRDEDSRAAFTPEEIAQMIACWALRDGPGDAVTQARANRLPDPLIVYGLHLAETNPHGVAVRALETFQDAGAPVPPWLTPHLPPGAAPAPAAPQSASQPEEETPEDGRSAAP
jgi:hypothetical protein